MAAAFLATHGVNLQHEMSKAQFPELYHSTSAPPLSLRPITLLSGVLLPTIHPTALHDVYLSPTTHRITQIIPHRPNPFSRPSTLPATACLVLPSLCHPHIHLDKCHLHSHPHYSSLRAQSGTFTEALSLTSRAKSLFTTPDLLQRGEWLIAESVAAGVTHMRAFVEVDSVARFKGLEAGLKLKRGWQGRCEVQICAFAQEACFTNSRENKDEGEENRRLIEEAMELEGVDCVGSTPYVEGDEEKARKNIGWIVKLAMKKEKHLDLHLDYHLDKTKEALVWYVLEVLRREGWAEKGNGKTVCLGHCTRMTLFSQSEWKRLKKEVQGLKVSFVGLPTSDLFMMGRPDEGEGWKDRGRGTLQVPWMIKELGINAAVGVNNVGNAFTPQGSADPLTVASLGVGLYQAGTEENASLLYECVSTRAKEAIGFASSPLKLSEGAPADLVLYGPPREKEKEPRNHRRRNTVLEIVCDAGAHRTILKNAHIIPTE